MNEKPVDIGGKLFARHIRPRYGQWNGYAAFPPDLTKLGWGFGITTILPATDFIPFIGQPSHPIEAISLGPLSDVDEVGIFANDEAGYTGGRAPDFLAQNGDPGIPNIKVSTRQPWIGPLRNFVVMPIWPMVSGLDTIRAPQLDLILWAKAPAVFPCMRPAMRQYWSAVAWPLPGDWYVWVPGRRRARLTVTAGASTPTVNVFMNTIKAGGGGIREVTVALGTTAPTTGTTTQLDLALPPGVDVLRINVATNAPSEMCIEVADNYQ